jgi:hypothetical protein
MSKRVGVKGDVQPTNGTTQPEKGTGGTWASGPIRYQTYAYLKVGGTPAIYEASCTFTWNGMLKADPSKAHSPEYSTVTLTATTKLTQKGSKKVLVDGDSAQDEYGNKLQVSAAGVLKTD